MSHRSGRPGAGSTEARLDVRAFHRRRFVRIYPPYLAALALSAAVAWGMGPAQLRSALIQVPTAAQLASHLLLVHTAVPGHHSAVNAVLWTIALEAHFYVLYPLLLAARRRVGTPGVCALLLGIALASRAAALALLPASSGRLVDDSILRRGWEFGLGMWVAERLAREPGRRKRARLTWAVLAGATLAGGLGLALAPGGLRVRALLWPVLFGAAVEAAARWRPGASPADRLARWLGERSYSLYLVHPVALAVAMAIAQGWTGSRGLACAAMLLCTAAAFVAFHRWIEERPFAVHDAAPRARAVPLPSRSP